MLRFYVLCCRNIIALKRHIRSIPKEDLTIVINTLDKSFEAKAISYCKENNIEYFVTESNGTPSKGKNSVLDIFESSNYTHMVLVDGDDFLTPHGVWSYKQIANSENAPDVLGLEYQYGIWPEYGYNTVLGMSSDYIEGADNPYLNCSNKQDPDQIQGHGTRCFLQEYNWWYENLNGLVNNTDTEYGKAFNKVFTRWVNHCYKYISNWETHIRLVMFSKKAVNGFRYNPDFKVGEDTLLYLTYKDQHVKGNLVLNNLYEKYPTYVYDCRVGGIVEECKHVWDEKQEEWIFDRGWYTWLSKLTDKYDEMESNNLLHKIKIPEYNLVLPEGYIPNTMGLVKYPAPDNIIYA